MASLYVPYHGEKPAAFVVNGHRVVLISPEKEVAVECLEQVGADSVYEVQLDSINEQEEFFGRLAASVNGGVVIVPVGTDFHQVVSELEGQLPWVH
jgi:hypothetical protein